MPLCIYPEVNRIYVFDIKYIYMILFICTVQFGLLVVQIDILHAIYSHGYIKALLYCIVYTCTYF